MTTSGTTTFNPDFVELIEEAGERAGHEIRNGYDMKTARRSINLLFADWANRGVNLWTVEARSKALLEDTATYTLGTDNDVVDVIEQMVRLVGSSPTAQYNMTRVSISTQATRVNPTITGRPTEVWYDRTNGNPIANIWPLPSADGLYTLEYVVLRRMDDAGAYTNTGDMPFRFLPAFVSGLALMIAEKKSQDKPNLVLYLKQKYEPLMKTGNAQL